MNDIHHVMNSLHNNSPPELAHEYSSWLWVFLQTAGLQIAKNFLVGGSGYIVKFLARKYYVCFKSFSTQLCGRAWHLTYYCSNFCEICRGKRVGMNMLHHSSCFNHFHCQCEITIVGDESNYTCSIARMQEWDQTQHFISLIRVIRKVRKTQH